MIYLGTPSGAAVRQQMLTGPLGCMITPAQGMGYPVGTVWGADSGCGPKADGTPGDGYPGDDEYAHWLWKAMLREGADRCDPDTSGCLFATAPDVPFDAAATLERAERPTRMMAVIRHEIGLPVAFVAQDGMVPADLPVDDFDVLFVGGSKRWKASPGCRALLRTAQAAGKGTHLGMVNTLQWLKFACAEGYDHCDGTTLTRPDANLGPMLRWLGEVTRQPALW